ncbi:MAG: CDGSH iron-sulfur domain-containing protein [Acidobacteria bacterium]|nr:CDGSH iron-sulfur domain-containing protein [Acidobacteriota bacterium]MXZ72746.1 CDGSH iron-sulfur domain-containing protein [Acidobacteriota bacterium]MYD69859.1 CDGSH iron-sulfur domain-containing protein [Acidobacteriota bacterium]MYJ03735.1 CDGSH iron-sulfur domain-containing protein [Acidobacteriota bacterium]
MTAMPTTIRLRDNGPCLVDGDDITVVDAEGNRYEIARRPFSLCRCGHSENKPFCDGSHRGAGFTSAPRAGS